MPLRRITERLGRDETLNITGAAVSVVVAIALFTRFGINGALSRDESIYAYGGQQLSHGVAPYASIFDPKAPLASMIAGLAAALGRLVGINDLHAIRAAFFVCACLTVLAVYLLALRLWGSVVGAVVAAVVFASFRGFAADALSGPDAKTPGVLFGVLSMWFLARRQWFWAAFLGSLAVLVWQPFLFFALVAVILAAALSPTGERWRSFGKAVAGAAIPVVAITCYFALAGALGKFVESAVSYPLTGVSRPPETLGQRLRDIARVVRHGYKFSGVLFVVGLLLLVVLAVLVVLRNRGNLGRAWRDPLICVVVATLLGNALYAMTDFQGYPDLYPLLPYPALGFGGAAAALLPLVKTAPTRRIALAATLVALAVLAAFSWSWFGNDPLAKNGLHAEQADACATKAMLVPGTPLYALGDPTPLVLTGKRNPDRYIYLGSGVDKWKIAHTAGGFSGWTDQIRAAAPSVVVVHGWATPRKVAMGAWLRGAGYRSSHLGQWVVFLKPAARLRAVTRGIALTRKPTKVAAGVDGKRWPINCG